MMVESTKSLGSGSSQGMGEAVRGWHVEGGGGMWREGVACGGRGWHVEGGGGYVEGGGGVTNRKIVVCQLKYQTLHQ